MFTPTSMSSTEHVLVVGPGRDYPGRLRALRPGTRTTVICQVGLVDKVQESGSNERVIGVGSDAPDREWIDLAAAVHAVDPFTRIGTFGEVDQDRYAAIAQALGLHSHTPETVRLVHDKEAMRVRLREQGVDVTASARVADLDELRAFFGETGGPCVVKPVSSSGSAGVTKVENSADLPEAFERAVGSYMGVSNTGVLVEEFLEGPQFSVEAFSEAGEHAVIGITRKYSDPATFVELGHVIPASLPVDTTLAIETCVMSALVALGVEFGPTHTEVVLTPAGPRLIETHVRMAGDMIPVLTLVATGVDIDDCTARQTLGEKVLPGIRAQLDKGLGSGYAAIWFAYLAASGTLEDVVGLGETRDLRGVMAADLLVEPGVEVGPLENSNGRVAYVRASAETQEQAVKIARSGANGLRFRLRVGSPDMETV